jgi:hypothetical protein
MLEQKDKLPVIEKYMWRLLDKFAAAWN